MKYKYYINGIHNTLPINQKTEELIPWAEQNFLYYLIDAGNVHAFVDMVTDKVKELNAKYPRTKGLIVEFNPAGKNSVTSISYLSIKTSERFYSLTFILYPIKGEVLC